jgi:hypothetical protein
MRKHTVRTGDVKSLATAAYPLLSRYSPIDDSMEVIIRLQAIDSLYAVELAPNATAMFFFEKRRTLTRMRNLRKFDLLRALRQ